MELTENKQKSFWERKEGMTGMFFLSLGAVGLFFAAPVLLTFFTMLVGIVGQMIALTALCVVLAGMLFVITNKKVQTLVGYMFKSVMRHITGWFIEIDPIGIMQSYISTLKSKRDTMESAKIKLQGQITVLQNKMKKYSADYDQAMKIVKVAKEQGKDAVFAVQSRQAGRLEKVNNEMYGPLLQQMQMHLRVLNKYFEVTGTVIDDLTNEVSVKKDQREMILSSYSAMSAAKKIINGGTDEKELFDQAMDFVVADFGMKMGEIDSFMESSQGFVEGLDLQNAVYNADALEKLKTWENKSGSILLGTNEKQMLIENHSSNVIDVVATPVDFSQILARRS
jgi:hypothetical protein